jgi:hypothetical protein
MTLVDHFPHPDSPLPGLPCDAGIAAAADRTGADGDGAWTENDNVVKPSATNFQARHDASQYIWPGVIDGIESVAKCALF